MDLFSCASFEQSLVVIVVITILTISFNEDILDGECDYSGQYVLWGWTVRINSAADAGACSNAGSGAAVAAAATPPPPRSWAVSSWISRLICLSSQSMPLADSSFFHSLRSCSFEEVAPRKSISADEFDGLRRWLGRFFAHCQQNERQMLVPLSQ